MDQILQSSIVIWAVWIIFGGLLVYTAVLTWSHLSLSKLFWQNVSGSNRVALPHLARKVSIPGTSSSNTENEALVLARGETDETEISAIPGKRGMIYPVAGRNGLHFTAQRCTSCQLCTYVCPVGAITTQESSLGYVRSFDLTTCIYCGLCEAACPTQAIKLTANTSPTRRVLSSFKVQGEVDKKACSECGRVVPFADLMAEHIYDLNSVIQVDILPDAAVVEPDDTIAQSRNVNERMFNQAQVNTPCYTCQQSVVELEEKICG